MTYLIQDTQLKVTFDFNSTTRTHLIDVTNLFTEIPENIKSTNTKVDFTNAIQSEIPSLLFKAIASILNIDVNVNYSQKECNINLTYREDESDMLIITAPFGDDLQNITSPDVSMNPYEAHLKNVPLLDALTQKSVLDALNVTHSFIFVDHI